MSERANEGESKSKRYRDRRREGDIEARERDIGREGASEGARERGSEGARERESVGARVRVRARERVSE